MDKQTQKNLLELVKKNYEEIAENFDITRKKQLWPELLKLAEMVKDGDRILDVGCGNGRLIEAFGEKKIEYLGVDSSEKLVETAKKNLGSRLRGHDKLAVGDILKLDKLPEKDFNYVFCIAVLHHLPGEDLRLEALKQMKNKINSNGKIIITVWNLWSRWKFIKLIFKYGWFKSAGKNQMDFGDILFDWKNNKGERISRRYYHAFTKNELKKLSVRAGFKAEKIYKDKYNYYAILTK
ncbi:MAG: class I SAM-dependent methyltransferase [Patescibacteria group bacterium]|nr:class I SAM-dependent methyltransferase [Patescibacteria group bacterium]